MLPARLIATSPVELEATPRPRGDDELPNSDYLETRSIEMRIDEAIASLVPASAW